MSAITVDGDLVHYEVLGRGRTVVLVHGWIGSWRYWIPLMRQLQLKYRVYALDLFGFGDSGKNPTKYSLEQQINLVEDFMKQLGIPKAAMIGHGLGAMVLTHYAQRNPDRVARMLLTGAPLLDPGDLMNRTPPGARVLLTPSNAHPFPMRLQQQQEASKPPEQEAAPPLSAPNKLSAEMAALASDAAKAQTQETASVAPDKPETPATGNADTTAPQSLEEKAAPDKPETPVTLNVNATTPQPLAEKIVPLEPASAALSDPQKLQEAALRRGAAVLRGDGTASPQPSAPVAEAEAPSAPAAVPVEAAPLSGINLLKERLGTSPENLLARCFRRGDPEFEKMQVDLVKMDNSVIEKSIEGFDAGRMLDTLRMLNIPLVIVHGEDDPVISAPTENIWQYLTLDKDDTVLPIPLPGVRHFPMLEHEPFTRLVGDFLETLDISKLEVKERWRRRTR